MLICLCALALLCGAGEAAAADLIVVFTVAESAKTNRYSDEEKFSSRDRARYFLMVNHSTYEYRWVFLLPGKFYNPDSMSYGFSDFVETTTGTGRSYLTLNVRGPGDRWEHGDNVYSRHGGLDTLSARVRSLRFSIDNDDRIEIQAPAFFQGTGAREAIARGSNYRIPSFRSNRFGVRLSRRLITAVNRSNGDSTLALAQAAIVEYLKSRGYEFDNFPS
jgi:hypothetical protein